MFFYAGYTCPVCGKPFTETDDVVACPQCGLPHHRACWLKEGHCHLADKHGTPEQWDKDAVSSPEQPTATEETATPPEGTLDGRICPHCHTRNPEYAEFCNHCGREMNAGDWSSQTPPQPSHGSGYSEYKPFSAVQNPMPDIPADTDIEGVRAEDMNAITGIRAGYYTPRFLHMARGSRVSWNWCAFFFGPYWMLYRKMFSGGSLFLLLELLLNSGISFAFTKLGFYDALSESAMLQKYSEAMSTRSGSYFLLSVSLIAGILFLARIFLGCCGNRLYQNHCRNTIRRAREITPDLTASEIASQGGSSIGFALVGYFAGYVFLQIVQMLLL